MFVLFAGVFGYLLFYVVKGLVVAIKDGELGDLLRKYKAKENPIPLKERIKKKMEEHRNSLMAQAFWGEEIDKQEINDAIIETELNLIKLEK